MHHQIILVIVLVILFLFLLFFCDVLNFLLGKVYGFIDILHIIDVVILVNKAY